jgi:hypothetical protein
MIAKPLLIVLNSIGLWIVIDGAGSIVVYRQQKWYEHLIRVIRIGAGLVLIAGGWIA